jgi:GntR family transcriptional repressor for pyruvate dehydrogenase complex
MSPFTPVQRQRLSEIIVSEIEESILSGDLKVGEKLPSEQALASQFEVSRNVVREALKILQERGLIEIMDGSGAFVSLPKSEVTTNALGRYIRLTGAHQAVKNLYEVRRILEGQNARMAAERAQESDLEELRHYLAVMQENKDNRFIEKWTEADLDFHIAVARATHNPFMALLLEPLVGQLREVISEGYYQPEAVESGFQAHTVILNCVEKGDAEGAYTAMLAHLNDSEARIERHMENNHSNGN